VAAHKIKEMSDTILTLQDRLAPADIQRRCDPVLDFKEETCDEMKAACKLSETELEECWASISATKAPTPSACSASSTRSAEPHGQAAADGEHPTSEESVPNQDEEPCADRRVLQPFDGANWQEEGNYLTVHEGDSVEVCGPDEGGWTFVKIKKTLRGEMPSFHSGWIPTGFIAH